MNTIINDGLRAAMAAVCALDDQGCMVQSIDITGSRPIVRIDQPHGPFLRGALKTRITFNGVQRTIMVASVQGCQVEWSETHTLRQAVQS